MPVVLPISGTRKAGVEPSKEYPGLTKLGAEEYKDKVDAAVQQLSARGSSARRTRSQVLVLLHDREPSHTATLVKQWAEQKVLKLVLLPASCPDLTPMDATFFGSVTSAWQRRCLQEQTPWPQRATLFMELLQQTSPEPHIQHWRRALDACVAEHGGHIERRLQKRGH